MSTARDKFIDLLKRPAEGAVLTDRASTRIVQRVVFAPQLDPVHPGALHLGRDRSVPLDDGADVSAAEVALAALECGRPSAS